MTFEEGETIEGALGCPGLPVKGSQATAQQRTFPESQRSQESMKTELTGHRNEMLPGVHAALQRLCF